MRTRFGPARCCCETGPPPPNVRIRARYCSWAAGRDLAGAVVTVKYGGVTVASGTTDSGGFLSLYVSSLAAHYDVLVEPPAGWPTDRLASWHNPSYMWTVGHDLDVTLDPKVGYVCVPRFQRPIAKTLYIELDKVYALSWSAPANWTYSGKTGISVSPWHSGSGTATCNSTNTTKVFIAVTASATVDEAVNVKVNWGESSYCKDVGASMSIQYVDGVLLSREANKNSLATSIAGGLLTASGTLVPFGSPALACPTGTSFSITE